MILLTHGYFLKEDPKEKEVMKPYVPLGILYISAYLEQHGVNHSVFDSTFSSFENFCDYFKKEKPGLVGIYTNLMTKLNVIKMIRFIKGQPNNSCKIILGGPEIRYNVENYLNSGADLLVIGEGEQTFYELCQHFTITRELPLDIDGTAYRHDNKIVYTKERTLIKDVNVLPMPARNKINLKLYGDAWKKHHGYSMYSISTMRGCPYTCKWCSRAVYGGTYRRRSPKLVVEEMELLKKEYAPDRIWFVDDVFTISHKWLNEFRNELLNRNASIPYEIITRADRMSDEVISILKETGCFRIWIGAESGSQEIIDAMDRRVDVKMVKEMIIKAKAAGIEAGTFIMLGYPGEKKKDIRETIQHLKTAAPTFYTITLAYPITGTPLYNEVNATIKVKSAWDAITDRDYNFKQTYSKKFYVHALNWVYSEVNYSKAGSIFEKVKHKSKSLLAQTLMMIN